MRVEKLEKKKLSPKVNKTTIFRQVWDPYMHIYFLKDEVINIKVIDLSLVSATKQVSYKKTTYNARYDFYT